MIVIICIAKFEKNYIFEFVKYHLKLGFDKIYIYDNEDIPTYENILNEFKNKVIIKHYPKSFSNLPVQYDALKHFMNNLDPEIEYICHIDIDEFIVLKKHMNINQFVNEYIKDDCVGIGINWRFFGSSNSIHDYNTPNTQRFTFCEEVGNVHIKTIFKANAYAKYNTVHDIITKYGFIKNTNGNIIQGPFSTPPVIDVVQLNHYKSKTLAEFKEIRKRGRADISGYVYENVEDNFKKCDINEVECLYAKNFYLS